MEVRTNLRIALGKFVRLVHRPAMPSIDDGVFVNVGCGSTNHPRFINVDGYPWPHVHYVHRIDRLTMFRPNSVDLLYASHCLEHFGYRDIDGVIAEWVRVLKPGGVIRLSVPDFDKLLDIYRDSGDPENIVEQIMGGQNNKYNFHYAIFNKKNLTRHLLRAGCVDVREWVAGADELTTFDDFSRYQKDVGGRLYEVSLNVEARKA